MAIYFISTDDNYIKIGYSKNPEQRIRDLQTGSPRVIKVHGIIQGNQSKERDIHRMFSDFRYRGEWFELTTDILAYMGSQKKWKPGVIKRLKRKIQKPSTANVDTTFTDLGWRVEIQNQKGNLYWLHRKTLSDGKRKNKWQGRVDKVFSNPERLARYKRNSRRAVKRKQSAANCGKGR